MYTSDVYLHRMQVYRNTVAFIDHRLPFEKKKHIRHRNRNFLTILQIMCSENRVCTLLTATSCVWPAWLLDVRVVTHHEKNNQLKSKKRDTKMLIVF